MKLYKKKKDEPTLMFWVSEPIVLDKSKNWGEGNIQKHKDGCWVQIKNGKVSHLVAGDEFEPVGWSKYNFSKGTPYTMINSNLFWKRPVRAEQIYAPTVKMKTLDGEMDYDNSTRDGWVIYNTDMCGDPNFEDGWFMTNTDFKTQYEEVELCITQEEEQ